MLSLFAGIKKGLTPILLFNKREIKILIGFQQFYYFFGDSPPPPIKTTFISVRPEKMLTWTF